MDCNTEVDDRCLHLSRLYAAHVLQPAYMTADIEAFEHYHDTRLPSLLRYYLLNISRETSLRDLMKYTVDLSIRPMMCANRVILNAHVAAGWCTDEDIYRHLDLDEDNENMDVEDGTLHITKSMMVVVKGHGYGYVISRVVDSYIVQNLYDVLTNQSPPVI